MRLILLLAAGMLIAAAPHAEEPDPFAPLPPGDHFAALLSAARFGEPGADAAVEAWLDGHRDLPAAERLRGWSRLCKDYGALTWNRPRQRACTEKQKLTTAAGGDDDEAMANALADAPPVRAVGAARVPLIWNSFGSQSAEVTVNGVSLPWFVDTGAEISVVTKSLGDRIGVRIVADHVRVGSSTTDVFGEVGLIGLMRIGDAEVENVPVLILPDAQLKIGGVHQIDAILGLQVLVAFHRIAWVDGGTMLALGEAAPRTGPGAARLYWHEDGLGVPVSTPLGVRGAHLDTGANNSDWRVGGVPLVDAATLARAKERVAHIGGAGGVVEVKQKTLPSLAFRLAGTSLVLRDVSVAEGSSAARIGMDAVSQFSTFILDFEAMRVEGRLKTAKERRRPGFRALTQQDIELPDAKKDAHPRR
jgi:hypothetical protein